MWPAYIKACRANVPGANEKMVFDRFHLMRHVLDAVDKVRKREHKVRIPLKLDTHSTANWTVGA